MEAHEDNQLCIKTREQIGLLETDALVGDCASIRADVENHLAQCAACVTWRQQSSDVVAAASMLPQFDVPEALTQRILLAVEDEQRARAGIASAAIWTAVAVVACVVLVLFDSLESIEGLMSWCVGLGAMAVIRLLFANNDSSKTITTH